MKKFYIYDIGITVDELLKWCGEKCVSVSIGAAIHEATHIAEIDASLVWENHISVGVIQ